MGYQVIKQPDGLLAIWSSFTDGWACYDASPDEVVEFFIEKAADSARRDAQRIVELIQADEPRRAYFQFAMTYEQAEAKAEEGERMADLRASGD